MRVLVILPQAFEDLEAAAIIDVLGWTADCAAIDLSIDTCGLDNVVISARGVNVVPDFIIDDVEVSHYRAVGLPGGYHGRGYVQAYEQSVLDVLTSVHAQGGIIASICVGALPVARSGLLRGKKATTYPHDDGKHIEMLEQFGATYSAEAVEQDDRIITGNGPGAALGVAFCLAQHLFGDDEVKAAKKYMCIG